MPVNGKQISFEAPCDCSVTEYLQIDGENYSVVDSLCRPVTGKEGQWATGAIVSVVLDVDKKYAYVQNVGGGIVLEETATLLGLEDGATIDDALERLHSIANGKAVITTGSYTPSETVHGYSLTFDFEPQVLMIFKAGAMTVPVETSSEANREDRGITFIKGCTTYPTYGQYYAAGHGYSYVKTALTVSFDGSTVSWTLPDTAYYTPAGAVPGNYPVAGGEGAFCGMNDTYHYVAIGVGASEGIPGAGEISNLPAVTTADNGKILQVVNGVWMAVPIADFKTNDT